MPRLRLSLTVPGTVPFGPYEGGALAALILATRALGENTLVIDSIASGSAGSIAGLLTARSLLGGVDPVTLFDAAWVHNASIEAMESRPTGTLPSPRALTAMAAGVLGANGLPSGPVSMRQNEPVRLAMALSNLDGGLIDDLPELERNGARPASTDFDWYSVELTNAAIPRDYLPLVDAVSASGSGVDVPADLREVAAGEPVEDGSLGRTIDLAESIGSDDERLYLLIHPDPALFSTRHSDVRCGGAPGPRSVRTGAFAVRISRLQSFYDDLGRLERTNGHGEWIEEVASISAVGDTLAVLRRRQADALCEARRIMTERESDRSDDYAALLRSLVHSAGRGEGCSNGTRPMRHAVESPGHFYDITSREHDFALGYRTMTTWLEARLGLYLPRVDLSAALGRIDQEYGRIEPQGLALEGPQPFPSLGEMAALGH